MLTWTAPDQNKVREATGASGIVYTIRPDSRGFFLSSADGPDGKATRNNRRQSLTVCLELAEYLEDHKTSEPPVSPPHDPTPNAGPAAIPARDLPGVGPVWMEPEQTVTAPQTSASAPPIDVPPETVPSITPAPEGEPSREQPPATVPQSVPVTPQPDLRPYRQPEPIQGFINYPPPDREFRRQAYSVRGGMLHRGGVPVNAGRRLLAPVY